MAKTVEYSPGLLDRVQRFIKERNNGCGFDPMDFLHKESIHLREEAELETTANTIFVTLSLDGNGSRAQMLDQIAELSPERAAGFFVGVLRHTVGTKRGEWLPGVLESLGELYREKGLHDHRRLLSVQIADQLDSEKPWITEEARAAILESVIPHAEMDISEVSKGDIFEYGSSFFPQPEDGT
jgi:hypothetical protein